MASGSHSTSGTDGTNGTSNTVKNSRRGIVNMLKIKKARSKGIVQKVSWNELGKPIGKGSTTLSYFIGSYARRHVPITCSNWRKKDLRNIKEALWDEVKQTFDGIEEEHKEKIISRAGTLHRQFRTRLRDLSRDEDGNYSVEPPLLYAHLSTVAPYWKEFVESSTDEVFVEKSKKNKVQAEAMEARYKKACVGYARIREIIIAEKIKAGETNPVVSRLDAWEYARRNASGVVDDPVTLQVLEDVIAISNQLEEHELTNIGTDDLLARLIPLEYPGRVRAVGWGVTKTSLQKHSSGSKITKLKNDIAFLKNEIKELKCKGYIPGAHSGGSSHMDNFDIDNDVSGDHIDDHDTVLSKDLPEGKNPCYLYLDPSRRYVGRGILWNDLNDRMLHGVSLEEEYVRVQFEVATPSEFKTQVALPSPYQCGTVATSSVSQSAVKRKRSKRKRTTFPPVETRNGVPAAAEVHPPRRKEDASKVTSLAIVDQEIPPAETSDGVPAAAEVHLPQRKKDASNVSSLSVVDQEMPPAETRVDVPALELPSSPEEENPIRDLPEPPLEPDQRQQLLNAASVLKSLLVARLTSSGNKLSTKEMTILAKKEYCTLEGLRDEDATFRTKVDQLISQHRRLEIFAEEKETSNEQDIKARHDQQVQCLSEVTQKLHSAEDQVHTAKTKADSLKLKREKLTSAILKLAEELSEVEETVKTLNAERDQCEEAHSVAEAELRKLDAEKEEACERYREIEDRYNTASEELKRMSTDLLQLVRR